MKRPDEQDHFRIELLFRFAQDAEVLERPPEKHQIKDQDRNAAFDRDLEMVICTSCQTSE